MSDLHPPDEPPERPGGEGGNDPGPGSVRPTGPGVLTLTGCLGLLLGYGIRPLTIWLDRPEPVLTVFPVLIVWILAAGVGVHAWNTWRNLQRPAGSARRLQPHQAVNRLMLGKASAIVAALLLGGYLGFAMAHLFIVQTDLSQQRLVRSLIAAAGSLALLVGGLALERACRVRDDQDAP